MREQHLFVRVIATVTIMKSEVNRLGKVFRNAGIRID